MPCEWKLKLRLHSISDCLIEVVTKAGLTLFDFDFVLDDFAVVKLQKQRICGNDKKMSNFVVKSANKALTPFARMELWGYCI